MLKIKKVSDVINKHVYTTEGEYFGQVEDVNLMDNKVDGWKIKVSGGFTSSLGGARGVIIPHQFVKSIGDVFIITGGSIPAKESEVQSPGSQGSSSSSSMMTSGMDTF